MECTNCELRQRQFYCENCLRNQYVSIPTSLRVSWYCLSLRDFRRQIHHFAKDRDDQVTRATRALRSIEAARLARAGLASAHRRAEELADGLGQLRRDNEAS